MAVSGRIKRARRTLGVVAGAILLTTAFLTLTPNAPGIHYVQYRAAADLLLAGKNPYDPAAQAVLQRVMQAGKTHASLPYFYPPWLALACAPLSRLPYPAARDVFLLVTCLGLFDAANRLNALAPCLTRWATAVVVVGFLPALVAAQTSQVAPLVLWLTVAAWQALERGWDEAAGAALAGLTMKPQLAVALVPGVLLWAARRRRWRVIVACSLTLGLACLASTALFPHWLPEMLRAPGRADLPTRTRPEIGVTWPTLLRAAGLHGPPLAVAYLALAIPAAAAVARTAWDRDRPAGDVFGLGALAAFAIAPYAQFYDFPILMVTLFALLGDRRPTGARLGLLFVLVVGPYLNLYALMLAGWPAGTFAWVPAAMTVAWFVRSGSYHPSGRIWF